MTAHFETASIKFHQANTMLSLFFVALIMAAAQLPILEAAAGVASPQPSAVVAYQQVTSLP